MKVFVHVFLKGMAHIPEDRHKHGLVLDYNLAENFILKSYFDPKYQIKVLLNLIRCMKQLIS